jgi:hypothetical protein
MERRRTGYRLSRNVYPLICALPEGSQTSCHSRTEAEPEPDHLRHHDLQRVCRRVVGTAVLDELAGATALSIARSASVGTMILWPTLILGISPVPTSLYPSCRLIPKMLAASGTLTVTS